MKRIGLISILLGMGVLYGYSQDSIVSIPDTVFLYALIDEEVDTDGDSLISYGEAFDIKELDISHNFENRGNISDLTGIEAFGNLIDLDCSYNIL